MLLTDRMTDRQTTPIA